MEVVPYKLLGMGIEGKRVQDKSLVLGLMSWKAIGWDIGEIPLLPFDVNFSGQSTISMIGLKMS